VHLHGRRDRPEQHKIAETTRQKFRPVRTPYAETTGSICQKQSLVLQHKSTELLEAFHVDKHL
jgi:hypothetical protein